MGSGNSKKQKSEPETNLKQPINNLKKQNSQKVENDIVGNINSRLEVENIKETENKNPNDNFMIKKSNTLSVSRANNTNKNIKKAGDLQQSHDLNDLEEINLDGIYMDKKSKFSNYNQKQGNTNNTQNLTNSAQPSFFKKQTNTTLVISKGPANDNLGSICDHSKVLGKKPDEMVTKNSMAESQNSTQNNTFNKKISYLSDSHDNGVKTITEKSFHDTDRGENFSLSQSNGYVTKSTARRLNILNNSSNLTSMIGGSTSRQNIGYSTNMDKNSQSIDSYIDNDLEEFVIN